MRAGGERVGVTVLVGMAHVKRSTSERASKHVHTSIDQPLRKVASDQPLRKVVKKSVIRSYEYMK